MPLVPRRRCGKRGRDLQEGRLRGGEPPGEDHRRQNPAYADFREAQSRSWAESPGDPTATRDAILKVVDADKPPLRIFFGKTPIEVVTKDYESRLATWNEWQPVSVEAYGA